MEKAILKTLIYADIFDYPLKINEIHKWLIGKKVTLRQVEKTLKKLNKELYTPATQARIKNKGDYFFLRKDDGLVLQRRRREKQSAIYFKKAKIISQVLKLIPWIKLVGVSGGLAMGNAERRDDIDLFIITAKKRLWISRLLALGLLSLTGQRRKVGEKGRKIAGRLCLNILLEEDKLEQKNKDIYVAHEVLQMKVLWQRDGIYSGYLSDNEWAFKFLPNWITDTRGPAGSQPQRASSIASLLRLRAGAPRSPSPLATLLEKLAKWLQLKIMSKPQGMERIEDGALYFHPEDCRMEVLSKYQKKLKIISP